MLSLTLIPCLLLYYKEVFKVQATILFELETGNITNQI